MERFHKILSAFALLALAAAVTAAEPDLAKRVAQQDGWVAYQVPINKDAGMACCYEFHGKHAAQAGCDLEGRSWSNGSDDRQLTRTASDTLNVYLRVEHAQVASVRAFSASCPVRDSDKVRWLDDVPSAQMSCRCSPASLAWRAIRPASGE